MTRGLPLRMTRRLCNGRYGPARCFRGRRSGSLSVRSGVVRVFACNGDDGEAFGGAEAGAVPPVSANGAGGDVGDAVPVYALVDVGVALEDGEDVVALEELDGGGAVDEGDVLWGLGAQGGVGGDGGDEGDVGGDDDGGAGGLFGEVGGEPG